MISSHAMEKENKWSITAHGTKINLIKGYLCDVYPILNVSVMIVGENQQTVLSKRTFNPYQQEVGNYFYRGHSIYSYKKSADEIFDPEKIVSERVVGQVVAIQEPYAMKGKDDRLFYYVSKSKTGNLHVDKIKSRLSFFKKDNQNKKAIHSYYYVDNKRKLYTTFQMSGDKGMQQLFKDLAQCYEIVLNKIHLYDAKDEKSIALPTLGTVDMPVAFPKGKAVSVAVASIFEYLKQQKEDTYKRIELVIETDFEFNWYKLLLMRACGVTDKIVQLYGVHHDVYEKQSEHFLYKIPRDVIDCVTQFFWYLS